MQYMCLDDCVCSGSWYKMGSLGSCLRIVWNPLCLQIFQTESARVGREETIESSCKQDRWPGPFQCLLQPHTALEQFMTLWLKYDSRFPLFWRNIMQLLWSKIWGSVLSDWLLTIGLVWIPEWPPLQISSKWPYIQSPEEGDCDPLLIRTVSALSDLSLG